MITAKMAKKIVEREGALLDKPVPNYDVLSLMVHDNAMLAFSNLEVRVLGRDGKEWAARLKKKGYIVELLPLEPFGRSKIVSPKEICWLQIFW